jgi:pimeloyl-ACP methyl ester carboxylesterase
MRKIVVEATPGVVAPVRIALLPGAYQEPDDFRREGFAEAVRCRGLAIDLEFVAPELAHVMDRAVLQSLHDHVVLPARAAGCSSLWLGGASLGGFLALAYAERRPDTVDGLCLLAPYLGNRMVTGEVARAGGVRHWRPAAIAADDEERRIWALIQRLPSQRLAVHLGVARQDRFGHGHALLADALPAAAVDVVDGGHDWDAWRRLWDLFLDRFAAPPASRPGPARLC